MMLIFVIELPSDNKSDLCFNSSIYYEEKNKEVFSIIIFPFQNNDKELYTDTPWLISFGLGTRIFLCFGMNCYFVELGLQQDIRCLCISFTVVQLSVWGFQEQRLVMGLNNVSITGFLNASLVHMPTSLLEVANWIIQSAFRFWCLEQKLFWQSEFLENTECASSMT